jgi:hypothetical protein
LLGVQYGGCFDTIVAADIGMHCIVLVSGSSNNRSSSAATYIGGGNDNIHVAKEQQSRSVVSAI